ncbi:MAG: XdhC family protein [Bacteroidota bacterium]|nr:XdhC family protein [Bacteroidota bacterium]
MKELKSIIDTFNKTDFSNHQAALATVVRVQGSSYRRAGARMIIIDDGRWTGAISGGCLEGDALRKARQAILKGIPSLVTYDTMKDNDAMKFGVGLGCNGVIDVLIEPIDANNPVQISFLQRYLEKDRPSVLATVFSSTIKEQNIIGTRWMLEDETSSSVDSLKNELDLFSPDFYQDLFQDMRSAFLHSASYNMEYYLEKGGQVNVFIEYLRPAIHLIIFGGGYDAIPLLAFAKQVGWKVTVTDDCVAHIAPSRFPQADELLNASRNEVVKKLKIDEFSAAVLLSHNYNYDIAVFRELLHTNIPYIGILGPRKKYDRMVEQLHHEGINIHENMLNNIFAPVGLDIGAELPEEIAISIIAEIQAKFNNGSGSMLRSKQGPIHSRAEEIQQAQDFLKIL